MDKCSRDTQEAVWLDGTVFLTTREKRHLEAFKTAEAFRLLPSPMESTECLYCPGPSRGSILAYQAFYGPLNWWRPHHQLAPRNWPGKPKEGKLLAGKNQK